jgi:hypothetical protein
MDMRQRIVDGYYSNPVLKPRPPMRPVPVLMASSEAANIETISILQIQFMKYREEVSLWESRMKAWTSSQYAVLERFKNDLDEYHGLTGHPKSALVFELSVRYSRPDDLLDIYEKYTEIKDLVL